MINDWYYHIYPKYWDPLLLAKLVLKLNLIVLGFNDTSTLVGHFVSAPREREKRDRRDSRRDEREGQGGGTGMKVKKQKK